MFRSAELKACGVSHNHRIHSLPKDKYLPPKGFGIGVPLPAHHQPVRRERARSYLVERETDQTSSRISF
jgi:hypothetical protein